MLNNPYYLEYSTAAVPKISSLKPMIISPDSNQDYDFPNLNASYIRFKTNFTQNMKLSSSNVFYVLKGSGETIISTLDDKYNNYYPVNKSIIWKKGDVFTIPYINGSILHKNKSDQSVLLFNVNDKPLLNFLNCKPTKPRFISTFYDHREIKKQLEKFNSQNGSNLRNRNGVLLSNQNMIDEKLNTLTHNMWSLINVIKSKQIQKPHKHNSIAIDLCINMNINDYGKIYTLMGEKIDANGEIIDPVKMNWKKDWTFTTPPGWWHSHHNEGDNDAWVFPVQDAGLHTYLRTLDIQFVV